jgi:hypothetical protein
MEVATLDFYNTSTITANKSFKVHGWYYKTLAVCNLWQNDKFCSKLASSGLEST